MYLIFDHLTSIVIGTVVLVLLAGLHLGTQNENIDAIRSETNRARLLDFVHVLERDLRNAGSGATEPGVIAWSDVAPSAGQPVAALEFFTTVDTSATALPSRLRYDIAVSDSSKIEGQWVYLYELRRLEHDGTDFALVSSSTPTVRKFELTLLDESGTVTALPSLARAFAVRVVTISPHGVDNITSDSRWETVIWPVNLRLF
jgi:hypothetical protein